MQTIRILTFSSIFLLAACGGETETPPVKNDGPAQTETPSTEEKSEPEAKKQEPDRHSDIETRRETAEDKAMDRVWQIPEVVALNESIRRKTQNRRGLRTFVAAPPSDDQEFYLISVAEDNGDAFATYYQFCVYPDFTVRYFDAVSDEIISLEKWRKQLKKEERRNDAL